MRQTVLKTAFSVGLVLAPAGASWAQDGEILPENSELYPSEPYDGCIDTLGEIFDMKALEAGIHPMLLRNLYRGILDEAAANTDPNTPPSEIIDVPHFNEKLDILPHDLRQLIYILTRDPQAADYFGEGCDIDI